MKADWWVRCVPALALLHLALFVFLQARLGSIGVLLWYVGPSLLAVLAAGLLFASLISSTRWRRGVNRWHIAGYVGLVAIVASLRIYHTYPSSYDGSPSSVRFRLPLEGSVRVAWGGVTADVNYHVILPPQRWGYDLLLTKQGKSFREDATRLQDYYCYDLPVLAPADGVVLTVRDGEPDVAIGQRREAETTLGNHVVLEVAPSEFLFIAHLRPGSVAVRQGERVHTRQQIGRVGNSGNSSEPHVHLHLQDTTRPYLGEGIPFYFHNYRQAGKFVERGMPQGGRSDDQFLGQVIVTLGASAW